MDASSAGMLRGHLDVDIRRRIGFSGLLDLARVFPSTRVYPFSLIFFVRKVTFPPFLEAGEVGMEKCPRGLATSFGIMSH